MMRKTVLLLASMALIVLLASVVAVADTISCPNRSRNVCVGTDNRDTMTGTVSSDDMRGMGGDDTLHARGADDKLTGGSGDDTLDGGSGFDSLDGASGNDTYFFNDGWVQDTIDADGGGVDTLDFSASSRGVSVWLAPKGGSGNPEAIDGKNVLNISTTGTVIENVRGTERGDFISGNEANNTLLGNVGQDILVGLRENDILLGGAGGDSLTGDLGDDQLRGGEGNDRYDYTAATWNNDTIIDTAVSNSDTRSHSKLIFRSDVTRDLTINLVSSSSVPEVYYTGSASGPNTIDWSNSVIDEVNSEASGNDTIEGNNTQNSILSHFGSDTVSAGGGNDFISVDDSGFSGSGSGDIVDCGGIVTPDNDTVFYDKGDTVSSNCEKRFRDGVLQP